MGRRYVDVLLPPGMRQCAWLFSFFSCSGDHRDLHSFLHDALPICHGQGTRGPHIERGGYDASSYPRSEEHTSELQSPCNLVCRLLLVKKKLTTYGYDAPKNGSVAADDGVSPSRVQIEERRHCRSRR